MRSIVISSLVLGAIACGGGSKPAQSASDNSAVEANNSTTKPSSDESAASGSASDAGAAAPDAATTGEAAPAPPTHPTPTVTGTLDGISFAPTIAHVVGKPKADGRIVVSLENSTDCSGAPDQAITLLISYKDGNKSDLGALKRGSKKNAAEAAFLRVGPDAKKEYSSTFKPTGTVTVVKTAADSSTPGKLKLDLTSGDYMLNGDIDIQMCEAPAAAAKADATAKKPAGKKAGTKPAK
jgi:hypothetical protein